MGDRTEQREECQASKGWCDFNFMTSHILQEIMSPIRLPHGMK